MNKAPAKLAGALFMSCSCFSGALLDQPTKQGNAGIFYVSPRFNLIAQVRALQLRGAPWAVVVSR